VQILALDLGAVTGWLLAPAGSTRPPQLLKLKGGRVEDRAVSLACWLHDLLSKSAIDLVALEHFLPPGALKGFSSASTTEAMIGYAYVVRAIAGANGVPVRSPYPATIRKHFLGSARTSAGRAKGVARTAADIKAARSAVKAATIKRAQLLGYIPRDCTEENLADVSALFDFASSYWGRSTASFVLTPETSSP
jgi:hypothetical protein